MSTGQVVRKLSPSVLSLVLAVGVCGCGATTAPSQRYTKYNIHCQSRMDHGGFEVTKASSANWTGEGPGHSIIPASTRVTTEAFREGFSIRPEGDSRKILFEARLQHTAMSPEQYIDLITSAEPVSLAGFGEVDLKGIHDGKAYEGMTKDGVMVALGYPSRHATPSLDANVWVYGTTRFKAMRVVFGDDGKVLRTEE